MRTVKLSGCWCGSPQVAAYADAQHRTAGKDCRGGFAAANANADGLGLFGLLLEAAEGEEEGEDRFQATARNIAGGDVLQAADRLTAQHMQTRVDVVELSMKQRNTIYREFKSQLRKCRHPNLIINDDSSLEPVEPPNTNVNPRAALSPNRLRVVTLT